MKTNIKFGIGALLVAALLLGMVMAPAVSAEKITDVKSEDRKPIETSKHVSKPEILLNDSAITINALSDPAPSTSGLTLIGSDSASTSNIWGDILSSYRMYTVNNENDPNYDYYVIWLQATAKTNIFGLSWIKVGIKDITNGQIVDWSPTGTTNTNSGQQTTISLGVTVPGASATVSQTFNDPTGKIYPNIFTTTQFESKWEANPSTYDPGFSTGGVMIKSPAGRTPSFTWYSSAY